MHACISAIDQQFDLRIPNGHEAYGQLKDIFAASLKEQNDVGFMDLDEGGRHAALMVPPWSWLDRYEDVLRTLYSHRTTEDLEWNWPLVQGALKFCRCVFTSEEVQVKPFFPHVDRIPSFVQAKRRIYLTATLSDDSGIVTHFAADIATVRSSITPDSAADIRDRLILVPQMYNPAWTEEFMKQFLVEESARFNVVVIVPSARRAAWWSDVSQLTLDASNLMEGVDRLREGHVGLAVMVNKYDGVDLPGNACRILAIDALPEFASPVDRMDAVFLDDTPAMLSRQLQRIEQGMGRGIRSRDDYCAVILLGNKLVYRLNDPDSAKHFSPATNAQLRLSRQLGEQLNTGTLDDLKSAVTRFLDRDRDWLTASRNSLVGVKYGEGLVQESWGHAREAFDQAAISQHQQAVDA